MKDYVIIKQDNNHITEVKRISDNMIFKLGDNVKCSTSGLVYGKITKIWISFNQLRIDIDRLGLVLCVDDEKRQDIILCKYLY